MAEKFMHIAIILFMFYSACKGNDEIEERKWGYYARKQFSETVTKESSNGSDGDWSFVGVTTMDTAFNHQYKYELTAKEFKYGVCPASHQYMCSVQTHEETYMCVDKDMSEQEQFNDTEEKIGQIVVDETFTFAKCSNGGWVSDDFIELLHEMSKPTEELPPVDGPKCFVAFFMEKEKIDQNPTVTPTYSSKDSHVKIFANPLKFSKTNHYFTLVNLNYPKLYKHLQYEELHCNYYPGGFDSRLALYYNGRKVTTFFKEINFEKLEEEEGTEEEEETGEEEETEEEEEEKEKQKKHFYVPFIIISCVTFFLSYHCFANICVNRGFTEEEVFFANEEQIIIIEV